MLGGSIVNEWDQIVRNLTVSSNESQAYRLYDNIEATYWQSSGPQGKVINIIISFKDHTTLALDSTGNTT